MARSELSWKEKKVYFNVRFVFYRDFSIILRKVLFCCLCLLFNEVYPIVIVVIPGCEIFSIDSVKFCKDFLTFLLLFFLLFLSISLYRKIDISETRCNVRKYHDIFTKIFMMIYCQIIMY